MMLFPTKVQNLKTDDNVTLRSLGTPDKLRAMGLPYTPTSTGKVKTMPVKEQPKTGNVHDYRITLVVSRPRQADKTQDFTVPYGYTVTITNRR